MNPVPDRRSDHEFPLSPLLSAVGRSWWILLLYGLVALGFGIIAIGWPLSAAMALAWTLGVMAIIEGSSACSH